MPDDECVFQNSGGPHAKSMDPWCSRHERRAILCLRETRLRAESAELGCEIAYKREPTQEEGDAHEGATRLDGLRLPDGECFVPMGGWTGRRCRVCCRWTWGGPTVCVGCAASEDTNCVLRHPRFFRVERCHWGHIEGECPQPPEACDGAYPCWRYDVGVGLTEGRVSWTHGATVDEAIAKMAGLIRGGKGGAR